MSPYLDNLIRSARRPEFLYRFFGALAEQFGRVWYRCEKRGWCDTWGGAESERVFTDWCEAGCPLEMARFIRERANIDANGKEPE